MYIFTSSQVRLILSVERPTDIETISHFVLHAVPVRLSSPVLNTTSPLQHYHHNWKINQEQNHLVLARTNPGRTALTEVRVRIRGVCTDTERLSNLSMRRTVIGRCHSWGTQIWSTALSIGRSEKAAQRKGKQN